MNETAQNLYEQIITQLENGKLTEADLQSILDFAERLATKKEAEQESKP